MAKPVNWTIRLPRASLRGVADVTRPIRAIVETVDDQAELADDTSVDPTPQKRGATRHEFARRALDEANRLGTEVVEVRSDRAAGPRFLPADRGPTLVVAPLASWHAYPSARPGQLSTNLAADDCRYGIALCFDALSRYPEPLALMLELSRILEPGGQLFLIAPLIVPAPAGGQTSAGDDRRRYGLNYLLDIAALRIEYLEPVDRSSAYAVIARKSAARQPTGRRWDDPA